MSLIFGWLLKSALGRLTGTVLAALLLGGFFYGTWKIRGCMRQADTIKQYQRADEIRKEDKKTNEQIETEKKRIEAIPAPDFDLDAELQRLRSHAETEP